LPGGHHTHAVTLDGDGPFTERLYCGVRRAILEGRLQPGARLPSTRALSADLGLSRNVVVLAFEHLMAEGYVEGRKGSGTFVSRALPDATLAPSRPRQRVAAVRSRAQVSLSAQAERVAAVSPLPAPGTPVRAGLACDFRYGLPAVADFPQSLWTRLMARRAASLSVRTLGYGRSLGFGPLREALAGYVRRARGVNATADRVVIVNGAQQAFDLIARLFIDPGDRVVVEEPGYQAARQAFVAAGARPVAVPVDARGIDVSRLPRRGPVRLAYVTPSHQFPLGGILPLARRLELLRWADAVGAHVVEDDYDSEFRYEEPRQPSRVSTSPIASSASHVLQVLYPSLRIGYLVVPDALVGPPLRPQFLTDGQTPTFEQEVLTDFITGGHFERHLRRSRLRNAARRAALLAAIRETLGDEVSVSGENAGLHVVLWPRGLSHTGLDTVRRMARDRGVGVYPVTPYYMRPPRRAGLMLGYACLTEHEIREGMAILANVLREVASVPRRA
jgi:GntR family transcriptional regulator/MocR family aminotransferase